MIRKGDLDATEEYALALAEVARNGGDRWQVVGLLQPLLVRSGHRTKAREVLVDNLIAIGRWEAAVTHLDHQIAEAPADDGKKRAELEHKRAWCLDAMGRFEAGADGYRKAIEADPTRIPAYALLAEIYDYRLAQDKEGLDVLDQAIEKNPTSADARIARFSHQRMFGTREEANADLDAALKLEPKKPAVLLAASRWAQANGDFEKARALVVEGIKNDDADESLLKEAAELELRAGHPDKALELATRGLANVTKSGKQTRTVELQVFRTDLLIDAGKIAQAEAEIQAIRAQDPTTSLADFLRARLLVEGKNCRAAADLLEKIRLRLERDPYWNSRVNSLLGLAYLHLGDLDRRIQALTRALRTDPGWPPLAISLAQAYLESGQPARALELVDGIETPEAKVLAARAQLLATLAEPPRRRNWKDVDDAYKAATAGQSDTLDHVLLRADIARGRGDADKAEKILNEAMKRQLPEPKPESAALWLALAEMSAARRDPDRALSILADARNRFGDSAAIRIRTIRILAARATPRDIALFGHVVDDLEGFPADDRGRILRQLAEAWIRIGDPAAADAALRRAAAEMPNDLRSRSLQFELAVNRGQMDEARRVLGEMHVAEGPDGALVAFADAMFEARTAADSALERLLREVESGPLRKQPARLALVKVVLHERLHNTRALIDDLQTALDGGLRSAALTSRLVQILIDERRLNEASSVLSMLERTGPIPADLWYTALDVAAALHDDNRVRELMGFRYLEEIRDPAEMIRIGQALARIDDVAGAMTCFQRAIDLAPHASEPWTAAIRHLVRRNLPSDALVLANQTKTKAPARYRTFLTAQCAEALGEWAAAETTYRKALEERPRDAAPPTLKRTGRLPRVDRSADGGGGRVPDRDRRRCRTGNRRPRTPRPGGTPGSDRSGRGPPNARLERQPGRRRSPARSVSRRPRRDEATRGDPPARIVERSVARGSISAHSVAGTLGTDRGRGPSARADPDRAGRDADDARVLHPDVARPGSGRQRRSAPRTAAADGAELAANGGDDGSPAPGRAGGTVLTKPPKPADERSESAGSTPRKALSPETRKEAAARLRAWGFS